MIRTLSTDTVVYETEQHYFTGETLAWLSRCAKYMGQEPTLCVYAQGDNLMVSVPAPTGVDVPSSLRKVMDTLPCPGFLHLSYHAADGTIVEPVADDSDVREMHPAIICEGDISVIGIERFQQILSRMQGAGLSKVVLCISGSDDEGDAHFVSEGAEGGLNDADSSFIIKMAEKLATHEGNWEDCGGGYGSVDFVVQADGRLRAECMMAFRDGNGQDGDMSGTYYIFDPAIKNGVSRIEALAA